MDIYTAHKKRDFIRPNYFSVQCTFFNISVTWKGGKWCHFSITNLFNLQWSDFWQAGKHEEDTKYKQHKMDLQIKSHYFCHCPYHNKNLSKVSLWHFHWSQRCIPTSLMLCICCSLLLWQMPSIISFFSSQCISSNSLCRCPSGKKFVRTPVSIKLNKLHISRKPNKGSLQ